MDSPSDVIGRVSSVLRAIAGAEPHGVRTIDVALLAALPRPTAHRLLTAMAREGLVDRSGSGLWCVGPELFLLGLGAAPRYDSRNLAHPIVRQLAVATGESASFSVRRGDETVCLLHEEGTFPLRSHVLHEGIRFPLGVASAGIAILAFMPADEQRHYLDHQRLDRRLGDAHGRDRVEARLSAARSAGYAVNPGLIIEGSWGLGAAVFDRDERPIGALSLTGIESRFGPDRLQTLGTALLRAARDLSLRIQRQASPSQGR